ncbi:DUF4349 domain-containing protein [Pengzhenrongella sicca]|uniref:DUF4349 domain-containing protein n=1 Tax=Pengzhenrongella sicca TaxID=2819238 RepID=A0A8A4ZCB5_9MICO|nr:DUF4349 domain-containing protein [Pengzhenrongella sicca]QTE29514.1 DUF4349 domain-containing protein [Pengzhenrongella sicca]
MRRLVGPVVLSVLVAGLAAGCSATSTDGGDSAAPQGVEADSAGSGSLAQDAEAQAVTDPALAADATDRQVVTVGTVGIVAPDPTDAARQATALTEAAGGRVEGRTEQAASGDQGASAHLILRIPAARLTETLDAFAELGKVERLELSATDVTGQVQDLDARISALTVSVGRLEALLGAANTSTDLVELESALSGRQADLESMQAQRAGLADQVELTTITLDLTASPTVVVTSPRGFWTGLESGWNGLLATLAAVLIVTGVLLPWLAFVAVLGGAAFAVVRLVRRRRPAGPGGPVPVPATAGDLGDGGPGGPRPGQG